LVHAHDLSPRVFFDGEMMLISTVILLIVMVGTATLALYVVAGSQTGSRTLAERLAAATNELAVLRPSAEIGRTFEEVQAELPVGLVLVAHDERIVLHNRRALELLGVDDDGTPRSLSDVAGSTDAINSMRQAVHQRRDAAGVIVPQPGRFVDFSARPLDSGDALIVLQDVTELRHLRTVRRDFVANVSHELRTPLASIRLLVDTLEAGALDDGDVAASFVHRIGVETDQLVQMVNELLELSRIESGQLPFKREPVRIAEIVESAVTRLWVVAEDRGISESTEVSDSLPPALADKDQAVQVLLNLLFNAIKFTLPGGTVHIKADQLDRFVEIAVIDTGVGIHHEDLSRIFERFYKSDKSRVRSRGGTGLGLPIARHIVEAHGGSIWAESKEGHGSTFTFTLPTV